MIRLLYVFTFIFSLSFAQNGISQYYEAGFGIGASFYYGDLNAPELSTNLGNNKFAAQGFVRYLPSKLFGAKASLMYGKLAGDDALSSLEFQKIRNLSFESVILEATVMGEYYLFGYDAKAGTQLFSPYATAGFGMIFFNPTAEFEGQRYNLQPLGTEGQGLPGGPSRYSKVALVIPFGGGIKLKINDRWNFGVELIGRRSFTDYIDDVSANYADTDQLANFYGPVSAALADRRGEALGIPGLNTPGDQRGGANVDDYYFSLMFNLSANLESIFGIGKKNGSVDCPRF